jgi:hypothetical protein
MILRPYDGPIASPEGWMPLPKMGRRDFTGHVTQSLNAIFKEVKKTGERPVSSHQVLEAILNSWPTISELFGWA